MAPEQYIQELLYRYSCVVVPEFGAFLTQVKSAFIQKSTNTFYPPTKEISFNGQLSSNDGLLVSYMANAEGIAYEDMLNQVLETAARWKKELRQGNRLVLDRIGELWLNREGKVQFQPVKKVNYLTTSFGLSAVVAPPVTREVLKEEVEALEEKIPFIITPEERREGTSFRPLLKYAAVVLLALSAGITGFRFYEENLDKNQLARTRAQEIVSKNIQEATFFNTKPMELPAVTLPVAKKKKAVKMHHIIAGAFRIKANADKKIRILKARGYSAAYLGVNPHGLHQVTYGSYEDPRQALDDLKKIRQKESADAWLLSVK
ncbi:MAG: HU-CCDC81 and SPOR domain-containing protein [Flavobacteriaceae bacterium]|nr:SPOR domain-containing protein [Eudoraea sp.]MBT8312297.1 SPOR domain-containing protein [Eudoraea sp.]NNJ38706.1 HU-CCDC81 and SPOR domain-containing protein [Flavobacteriaceae bacterium]NNJ41560.1 HU-CCDC81 and SPOR domain-containing protein [Eudoraea sp.]